MSKAPIKNFIIDFDSTFTQVEAMDELAALSLANDTDKDAKITQIKNITDLAMNGELTFRESLEQRIDLLEADKKHLPPLINVLKKKISKSFTRNKAFFEQHAEHIYIISNGFKDFITPIVLDYHIKPENIFANSFIFDEHGAIIGFDKDNVLSKSNGKVELLKSLNIDGDIYVIGDGYNDYEIRAAGLANKFYAFTENVERDAVLQKADHIAPNLDEILYLNKLNTSISYPKNRLTVLLLENIHQHAVAKLKDEGYTVQIYPAGLDEDELCKQIKDVSILGIRSKTHVTARVLQNANRLIAIGAFCIGTNQIDLEACLKNGVAVFNAPFSNTRSVVELAIAEIIVLMRRLFDQSVAMHQGKWNKSASSSFEIRGKKLGIVGYGNIGSQLSVLAESLGLDVYYYDIDEKLALGNARKCESLAELLSKTDIVTLHVDGRESNEGLIGDKELSLMNEGAIFLNLSRGHVVDLQALQRHMESGKIAGAGMDVFPQEPKSNEEPFSSPLQHLNNVILTPHIGGSTLEAQENIASFVPGKIIDYINTGGTGNSVNFPNLQLPELANAHRLIHIHANMPGILAKINNVLAEHDINIVGQYLKTNEIIGYVITDIDKAYDKEVINALRSIDHTIKFRVLY